MIKISSLRRKADPLLIVSKRLPSYIKKEKINLTRNSNVNKKKCKILSDTSICSRTYKIYTKE